MAAHNLIYNGPARSLIVPGGPEAQDLSQMIHNFLKAAKARSTRHKNYAPLRPRLCVGVSALKYSAVGLFTTPIFVGTHAFCPGPQKCLSAARDQQAR